MEQTWDATAAGFRRYLITHRKTSDTATTYVQRLRPFWNWQLGSEEVGHDAVEEYIIANKAELKNGDIVNGIMFTAERKMRLA